MMPNTTTLDDVLLGVELAFVREERAAQRRQPLAFRAPTGRPTSRQDALMVMIDRITDAQLARLREDPRWAQTSTADRLVVQMVTERTISTGAGCPAPALGVFGRMARQMAQGDDVLGPDAPGSVLACAYFYEVAGHYWPCSIPHDLAVAYAVSGLPARADQEAR